MPNEKQYLEVFNDGQNDLHIRDAEAQEVIAAEVTVSDVNALPGTSSVIPVDVLIDIENAIEGAENVDAYLTGSVLTVVGRSGVPTQVDLLTLKEVINITLATSTSGQASDLLGLEIVIKDQQSQETLWSGEWQGQTLTVQFSAEYRYEIIFPALSGYITPENNKYHAVYGNTRNITATYIYESDAVDTFIIDDTIDNPATKISGSVNGDVVQWIRSHTHNYMVKKTDSGQAAVCKLKDTDNRYYFDNTSAVLSGEHGDTMNRLPDFWYECTSIGTHRWQVMLALSNVTGTMKKWDSRQLLGAFEGIVVNNKLYSRSGAQSTGNITQANSKTYARNRGTGYTIMKWQQHNIYALLFYAIYGTTDSQGVCGAGTNDYTKTMGATAAMGMEDTVNGGNGSSGPTRFLGLENPWGNKTEWIDNVVVNYNAAGNVFSITEDDGTVRTVTTMSGNNAHVWPTKMVLGEYFDLIAAPDNIVGDDSKGYCDGFYLSDQSSRVVWVSISNSGTVGGCAYAYASSDSSGSSADHGARLAFFGELTDYEDVEAFLALPVL